jgi:phage-related protein
LALVIEDIITWMEGGNSVIGMFLGSWEEFKAKLTPILMWLKEWFSVNLPIMLNNLKNIVTGVVIPTIIAAAQQVWQIISPLVLAIVDLVKIAWGFIVSMWERFSPILLKHLMIIAQWYGKYLAGIVDAVITAVGGIFKILGGLLRFLGGVFTLNWKEAWEGIKDIFFGIIDIITGAFKAVVNVVSTSVNALKSAVGLGKDLATDAVKAIPEVIRTVGTAAIVAGTGLGETGENISTEKFIEGARATAGAAQTVQLQPIVNVEVGQVRSEDDAAQVADMTSQAVNRALAEQARNIQASFPEIE